MTGTRVPAFLAALLLSLSLVMPWSALAAAASAQEATPVSAGTGADAVLLFAAPGMRPDLVEAFAAEGALPPRVACSAPSRRPRGRVCRHY